MPGPPRKPGARRQRRDGRTVAVGNRIVNVPDPPDGWTASTVEAWESYWASDVARVVDLASDLPAVERLFRLYDERQRAAAGYRAQRLVEGSQGQLVLNPLARVVAKLDSEIRQLEDRFGMNPRARLQLGVQLEAARKGLDSLSVDPFGDDDSE